MTTPMVLLIDVLWIGCFAALGALTRTGVSSVCHNFFGNSFPLGTLVVNVTGCFFLGWLVTHDLGESRRRLHLAMGSGFLGSLTTFSTFGMETVTQTQQGQWHVGVLNVAANLGLGLVGILLGMYVGMRTRA